MRACPDCLAEYGMGHRLGCRWFMSHYPVHHLEANGNFWTEYDPFLMPLSRPVVINPGLPTQETIYVRFESES